jgi:hypothetical protein
MFIQPTTTPPAMTNNIEKRITEILDLKTMTNETHTFEIFVSLTYKEFNYSIILIILGTTFVNVLLFKLYLFMKSYIQKKRSFEAKMGSDEEIANVQNQLTVEMIDNLSLTTIRSEDS